MKRRELKRMEICERGKEGSIKGSEGIGNKTVKKKDNDGTDDDEMK